MGTGENRETKCMQLEGAEVECRGLGPYEAPIACLLIANGTISPYRLTLVYRYVSAIVPLTSLLVLVAYGPRRLVVKGLAI